MNQEEGFIASKISHQEFKSTRSHPTNFGTNGWIILIAKLCLNFLASFKKILVNIKMIYVMFVSVKKKTRLPFPISDNKALNIFELIHCDIWGAYRVKSFYGADYFLSIVDDASRGVWVFLIKDKSEASQLVKNFCHMVNILNLILRRRSLQVIMEASSHKDL